MYFSAQDIAEMACLERSDSPLATRARNLLNEYFELVRKRAEIDAVIDEPPYYMGLKLSGTKFVARE